MSQGNLGIEPEVLKSIYGQMARIRAVDKAIQAEQAAQQPVAALEAPAAE